MWVGNRTSDKQSVLAVLDNTDPTERSWIATFNTANTLSTWNNSTSQVGDNISFSIHDYYDVNYDQQVGWAENPGVDIISTDDNLTITGVYDGLNVIFDNQPPDNISMSQLVSNNQLIDRFRPDEKAFFNFKVNEPVYLPEIQIGGFDNVTVVNSDNSTPYLNDNLTWYAEKIFLDNYTSNNNVFGNIVYKDLAGNTVTRTTNSIIFDNSLDNLSNVSLITSNPARLDNGTHQRYFAKESDNITLSFQANEPIQILRLEFGNEVFDNSSSNLSNPTGYNWVFIYEVTSSINFDNSTHNPLKFKITYTDLVKNDNVTVEKTNNSSLVEIDITPPTLDNVSIFSSNRNPEWAKSQDNVTLAFISNEPLKNRFNNQLRCNPSYNTICDDSIIVMAGDDNNSSGQTLQVLQNNGVLDYKRYSATRVFQTASPISNQHGDNVTFTDNFVDYAGNPASVNTTTDLSNVKYDDQKPDLTRIEISSDNLNSLTENVTSDKQLAKPGDNLTLSLTTPEYVEFLNLEFLSDNVTDNLSTSDNLSFSYKREMLVNDTSKNFYSSGCSSPYNPQTGCKIRFDIEATDFAGNVSIHDESNVTDNSTIKFDGISPSTTLVNFETKNCNSFAAKVGDNATLTIQTNEPIYTKSIETHYYNLPDNFTSSSGEVSIILDNTSLSGDLVSLSKFSTSRKFKETDHQSNSLIGGDTINFYTYFTDPAGNPFSVLNTTSDGSNIIFDRIPPKLDNITITTDSDSGFENFIMSGSLVNIDFTASEELRRKVNTTGINTNTTRKNCTGTCCINPYVIRTYCNNASVCTDNVSTMMDNNNLGNGFVFDNAKRDVELVTICHLLHMTMFVLLLLHLLSSQIIGIHYQINNM